MSIPDRRARLDHAHGVLSMLRDLGHDRVVGRTWRRPVGSAEGWCSPYLPAPRYASDCPDGNFQKSRLLGIGARRERAPGTRG